MKRSDFIIWSLDAVATVRYPNRSGHAAPVHRPAVAAEELGADGAYFRVHHFARQLSSPFPLLAAIGAKPKPSRSVPA